MEKLKATDIQGMSEELKNLVFAFDTARGRFKFCLIRGAAIPAIMILYGLFGIYLFPQMFVPPVGMEWMTIAMKWSGVFIIIVSILGGISMALNAPQYFHQSRRLAGILRAKGIDPSRLSSDAVWGGLFGEDK